MIFMTYPGLISWRMIPLFFLMAFIIAIHCPVLAGDGTEPGFPKAVTIAYNVSNPPLKFKDNGRADGILIDIWRLWSKKTGIPVVFKDAPFIGTLDMIKTGKADIHAGLFYTKDKDVFLDYTAPILDITYFIYHHESLKGIDATGHLLPFRVGVPTGYTHEFIKTRFPGAALAVYDNYPLLKFINQGLSSITAQEFRQLENKWLKEPGQGYYHTLGFLVELTGKEKEWLKTHKRHYPGLC